MTSDKKLRALADHVGVFSEFTDLGGVLRPTSPDTQRALVRATGLAVDTSADVSDTLKAVQAAHREALLPGDIIGSCAKTTRLPLVAGAQWQVLEEDTGRILAEGNSVGCITLPALPIGVHDIVVLAKGTETTATLIVPPAHSPLLTDLTKRDQVWGVVAALYGLHRKGGSGVGDFLDLANLARKLGDKGASFLGINPVHALGWADHETISPYSPSHRGFLNASHIASDQTSPEPLSELIDYAAHKSRHAEALTQAYAQFCENAPAQERAALVDFTVQGGVALADFALFETLSVEFGSDWRTWPEAYHSPHVARQQKGVKTDPFHIWMQWQAARQLQHAQDTAISSGMSLGLYLDLAVGSRLGGAEAWCAGKTLAKGVSIGAPPDFLSPEGQNWNIAGYAPNRLAADKYRAFRHVLRGAMRHCGVLRIDHALGLSRSYWIPQDGSPGGYIAQPFEALTAIISIEAHRAGTMVIGEDLGLVPPGFRADMARKGFYGYTVMQYEKTAKGNFRKPSQMRAQSLACFSTHDTPTLRGFWEGTDIAWWHKLGWTNDATSKQASQDRQREKADLMGRRKVEKIAQTTATEFRDRMHTRLAASPAALVAVQLDDMLGAVDPQNIPGTIDAHPNWRRRYDMTVAQITETPELDATARLMARHDRSAVTPEKEKDLT